MAIGPRQERIGNTPVAGEQNSARPGPDFTGRIASVKGQAEVAANRRKSTAPSGRLAKPADETRRGG